MSVYEPTLGYREILEALQRFEHWPNWKIFVRPNPYEGMDIRFEVEVDNTYSPGEMITLGIDSVVPTPLIHTVDDFYDWLMWRIQCVRAHETQEAFKVDGEAWADPHEPREWEQVV